MTRTQNLLPLSLLSISLPSVSAFWRQACGISQVSRADPIQWPGGIGTHVHTFAGGINVNPNSDYNSLRQSNCSTCEVQEDKSAYWTPTLYYEHADGSFVEVPSYGFTIYYTGRGDGATNANTQPFPPGFEMISGDSRLRSYDNTTLTYLNTRPVADRISFSCIKATDDVTETHFLNDTDCEFGLRAQVNFQSCWDGVNLSSPNQAHVAYLSDIDDGACPPTHPVHIPGLFLEVLFGVNDIPQSDGGRFVFSNGDTTGFGFHGDFINGWNENTLTAAIGQCLFEETDGQISYCAPLAAVDDVNFPRDCPQGPSSINEAVNGTDTTPLTSLPGCNPPTGGPDPALQVLCPANSTVPNPADPCPGMNSSMSTTMSSTTGIATTTPSFSNVTTSLTTTSNSLTVPPNSLTSTGSTLTTTSDTSLTIPPNSLTSGTTSTGSTLTTTFGTSSGTTPVSDTTGTSTGTSSGSTLTTTSGTSSVTTPVSDTTGTSSGTTSSGSTSGTGSLTTPTTGSLTTPTGSITTDSSSTLTTGTVPLSSISSTSTTSDDCPDMSTTTPLSGTTSSSSGTASTSSTLTTTGTASTGTSSNSQSTDSSTSNTGSTSGTDSSTTGTGTNSLTTSSSVAFTTGTNSLTTGTNSLTTGTNSLSTGTNSLTTPTNSLTTGTNSLSTGTNSLTTGTNSLTTPTVGTSTGTGSSSVTTSSSVAFTTGTSTNSLTTSTGGSTTGTASTTSFTSSFPTTFATSTISSSSVCSDAETVILTIDRDSIEFVTTITFCPPPATTTTTGVPGQSTTAISTPSQTTTSSSIIPLVECLPTPAVPTLRVRGRAVQFR